MAIAFNGTSGFVAIADSTVLRPNNISISAWFKMNSFAASSTIICKPYSGPPWTSPFLSFMIRVNNSTTIEFDVGNGSTYSGYSQTVTAMTAGTWYHAAMTYNGTTVTSYHNGALKGTNATVAGNIGYTAKPVLIGADYGASPALDYFNGSISDVRIYSRSLAAVEIESIYKSKTKYHSNVNGLIAYYPIDENSIGVSITSQLVLDKTINNNYGTGSGGGTYIGESVLSYGQLA